VSVTQDQAQAHVWRPAELLQCMDDPPPPSAERFSNLILCQLHELVSPDVKINKMYCF